MMDAANYAKTLKKPDDPSIVETQLTTDGVEDFGYTRRINDQDRLQIQRDQQDDTGEVRTDTDQVQDKNARVPSIAIVWSRDSKKFAVGAPGSTQSFQNCGSSIRYRTRGPRFESYSYTMPGEASAPVANLEVFDIAAKSRTPMKADGFKDQTVSIETERASARAREHEKTEGLWAGPGSSKIYFSRISRDMHRVDICVADTATGEVNQ